MAALMLGTGSLTASRSSFAGTRTRIQGEQQATVFEIPIRQYADPDWQGSRSCRRGQAPPLHLLKTAVLHGNGRAWTPGS